MVFEIWVKILLTDGGWQRILPPVLAPFPMTQTEQKWWQPAMVLFVEVGGWIAGPVIIAMFVGQWIDERYGSAPVGYFGAVGVAFIVSVIGLVRTSLRAMRDMEQLARRENVKSGQENVTNNSDLK